jgi:hypothetical protein
MDASSKQRTQIIVTALVVIVAAAGAVFYATHQAAPFGGSKNGGIVTIDPSQIPPGFPDGVPLFFQTKVLQNYTASKEGSSQATRQFEASSSAPAVFKMYEDFFLKVGWNVTPDYHPQVVSQKIFYATKGADNATVIVDAVLTAPRVDAPRQTVVTLNFFTKP